MGDGQRRNGEDFYAVLGLEKECSAADLRNAYLKLAKRWHPDRCSDSGNSMHVEEAKKKFQSIQEAYSILSDDKKRLMYNIGLLNDDDEENGMGDFLSEMAIMMSQNKCSENRNETFEDLQKLFVEMFWTDLKAFDSSSNIANFSSSTSSNSSSSERSSNTTHKHGSVQMNAGKSQGNAFAFEPHLEGFCLGTGGTPGKWQDGERKKGRNPRRSRK